MSLRITAIKPRAFATVQDPDTLPERMEVWSGTEDFKGRVLNEYRCAIGAAVEADHPCLDLESCDIAQALECGYSLAAAHLLSGATECATVEAVDKAYCWNYPQLRPTLEATPDGRLVRKSIWEAEFDEWCEYHADIYPAETHRCDACGGFTYLPDDPSECSHCGAPMNPPEEDE